MVGGILQVINDYLGNCGLMLRQGAVVDASIIHAPSSTKNKDVKRGPEMHQTKKGSMYFFGMKTHIDSESGLVYGVVGAAANVADVTQVDQLLHGENVSDDTGCAGWKNVQGIKIARWFGRLRRGPAATKKHGKRV